MALVEEHFIPISPMRNHHQQRTYIENKKVLLGQESVQLLSVRQYE